MQPDHLKAVITVTRVLRAHLKEAHRAENAADIGYLDEAVRALEAPAPAEAAEPAPASRRRKRPAK